MLVLVEELIKAASLMDKMNRCDSELTVLLISVKLVMVTTVAARHTAVYIY